MELSRDKIKEIINDDWLLMDDCEGNKNCDVVKEMARIALASLEAEPVAWLLSGGGAKNNVSFDSGNAYADPLREVTPLYTAPPAPVSVPAAMEIDDDFDSAFEHGKAVGWNAYRAAMLQGAKPVTTAYKLRDAVETIRNSGIEIDAEKIFAERDALNAPDCWCRTCRPVTISDMRFVVCPECGNKRCPHANDHRNACTGSNEPGQEGSAYPAAPQQEVTQALAKGMERYGDAMRELAKKEEK
ncbi:hypothetical protein [Escherichia coli]|uniref:hypothetical protein n=1 Tax=Escherichia coli TaxID=562 RepID=UPI0003BE1768|nr:hypothetical protein G723_03122 [Escherichia coli HVH 50 (4-2593475)]VVZ30109.1 Uncharacterised protein [Escherichia coli]DAM60100.1 MAG TPA: zinc-ribbon protein [Caudoviricetes sp.]VVZ67276.1 Uncharacterised protein [Escherichia coli]VWN06882.1 Uncharacterised protein [Escherichia coli]